MDTQKIVLTAQDLDRWRKYIASVSWKFAKTMPKHPHWYTVRWDLPQLDSEFCAFAQFIRDVGYQKNFFKKVLTYLDVDEYCYWTMGNPITKTTTYVLNRALLKDQTPRPHVQNRFF